MAFPGAAKFQRTLLRKLLLRADGHSRRRIPSQTLRKAVRIKYGPAKDEGRLFIPHYWARFVHNGSGAVSDKLMIWFKNPRQDPRLRRGQSPRRAGQRKHLSPRQLKAAIRRDQVVITRSRRAIPGRPWWDNRSMRNFRAGVFGIVRRDFSSFVKLKFGKLGVGKVLKL